MSRYLVAQGSWLPARRSTLGLAVNIAMSAMGNATAQRLPTPSSPVRYLLSAYLYVSYRPLSARRLDAGLGRIARFHGRRGFGRGLRACPASGARPASVGRSHVASHHAETSAGYRVRASAPSRCSAGVDVDDHTDASDIPFACCRRRASETARTTLLGLPPRPSCRVAGSRPCVGQR